MFELTLSDLVKGCRSYRDNMAEFVSKALREIRKELKNSDETVKTQAIQKLAYLHMIGWDMSWSAFNVVEVMSFAWFGHRRVGYQCAAIMFNKDTDVKVLTTHLFRKAFSGKSSKNLKSVAGLKYETGAAVSCLAQICNEELAVNLLSDIYGMMNSSQPYLRKKAVLMLLKVFRCFPKALRPSFERLKSKLQDSDPGVVSAAVYVICELAQKNPKNYLGLAPLFFHLLTHCSNNWVLIKLIKLIGALVPLEPRLAKKTTQPLVELVETTPAKSLLYEAINTLLKGPVPSKSVLRLCLEKLREFVEDPDQNLKYLGLLGLHNLLKVHWTAVAEHRDLVLSCLRDEDITIRMRALDLISSMASKRNLTSIVTRLLEHIRSCVGHEREVFIRRVVELSSQDHYAFVSDFEWYVTVLGELTRVGGVQADVARLVSDRLLDVTIRVVEVRPFVVQQMVLMLLEGRLVPSGAAAQTAANETMGEVLFAAAWIVGEYAPLLTGDHLPLIATLLSEQALLLSARVQRAFLQCFLKVFAAGLECSVRDAPESEEARGEQYVAPGLRLILKQLPIFARSNHVEVQERATHYLKFAKFLARKVGLEVLEEEKEKEEAEIQRVSPAELASVLKFFFCPDAANLLNPINPRAQKKVPLPKGLDLDAWINPPPKDSSSEEEMDVFAETPTTSMRGGSGTFDFEREHARKLTPQEIEQAKKKRERMRARRAADPFYITTAEREARKGETPVSVPPIREVTADFDLPPVVVESAPGSGMNTPKSYTVKRTADMPVGAVASDEEDTRGRRKGRVRHSSEGSSEEEDTLAGVDLTKPLQPHEMIQQVMTYEERQKKKKRKEEKKKKRKSERRRRKKSKRKHKKAKAGEAVEAEAVPAAKPVQTFDEFDPLSAKPAPVPVPAVVESKDVAERVLFVNDAVKVAYEVVLVQEQKKHKKTFPACLRLQIYARHPLKRMVLAFGADPSRVWSTAQERVEVKALRAGETREVEVPCVLKHVRKFSAVLSIPVTVGWGDTQQPLSLCVPLSTLVQPQRLTMKELSVLLADKEGECKWMASARIELRHCTVGDALKAVKSMLRVRLIEARAFAAAYYGQTLNKLHVAVLVKSNKAELDQNRHAISIDIKSSKQWLADGLVEEMRRALEQA